MTRDELRQLIQGPIATIPTPFDDDFEVDHGQMHALTQWWVDQGLVKGSAVIKVAAAMGEGPMLSDDEWPALLRTVVQAADDQATIVCGLHYKDTKRTLEDAKRAQDLGAIGLQVCPPVFNLPSQGDVIDYFSELSDAVTIGIMIYHTHWLPGGRVEVDTFDKLVELDQVVSVKWSAPEGVDYDEMARFADRVSVIDNGGGPVRCHQLGGRGFINVTSVVQPSHDLHVWELLEAKKYDEAQTAWDSVNTPLRDLYARFDERSGGQARLTKGMMKLVGHPAGDSRPPSKPLNESEMAELRETMQSFGWSVV